jgi:uncharacterized membrane protein YGL010W
MRTLDDWLDEYTQSHRDPVNKALHWICVPLIVFAVLGAFAALPAPGPLAAGGGWTTVVVLLALAYWMRLSWRLGLGMLPVLGAFALGLRALAASGPPLWQSCLGIFVVAWIGQFIGHAVEGRRPSFFKDLQFLLIGPLWLLAAAFRAAGLRR